MCVCARARVRMCVRLCVRASVCLSVCLSLCVFVCVCVGGGGGEGVTRRLVHGEKWKCVFW